MKGVILSQRIERDELLSREYIPREGMEDAKKSLNNSLVKVITGPRRAGKSVFALQMLSGTDFAYLNFDDERIAGITDFDSIIKAMIQVYGEIKTILFDEIQNIPKWELFINRLHRRGFNLIITGSNAHLLSRELGTHLTGRYTEFRILPFSFREFLPAKKFSIDDRLNLKERQGVLLNYLDEYIAHGGYPDIVVRGTDPNTYLATLIENVLFKDIVRRYNVRQPQKLRDLCTYFMSNAAKDYTSTAIMKALGFTSVNTVETYMRYLIEAYLLFITTRFSFKAKERIKAPRTAYAFDTGIIQATRFRIGADTGRLMENLVAVELLRRKEEFYKYKHPAGKEVDFVLRENGIITQLIQVCCDMTDPKTRKREITGLHKASAELNCKNKLIITWDEEGEIVAKDDTSPIKIIPLWRWLIGVDL